MEDRGGKLNKWNLYHLGDEEKLLKDVAIDSIKIRSKVHGLLFDFLLLSLVKADLVGRMDPFCEAVGSINFVNIFQRRTTPKDSVFTARHEILF